jgi:hypothetical protein
LLDGEAPGADLLGEERTMPDTPTADEPLDELVALLDELERFLQDHWRQAGDERARRLRFSLRVHRGEIAAHLPDHEPPPGLEQAWARAAARPPAVSQRVGELEQGIRSTLALLRMTPPHAVDAFTVGVVVQILRGALMRTIVDTAYPKN